MDKQPEEKERTKKKAPSQLGRDRARLLKYRTERKTKNENYNITYGKSDNSTQTKNNTEEKYTQTDPQSDSGIRFFNWKWFTKTKHSRNLKSTLQNTKMSTNRSNIKRDNKISTEEGKIGKQIEDNKKERNKGDTEVKEGQIEPEGKREGAEKDMSGEEEEYDEGKDEEEYEEEEGEQEEKGRRTITLDYSISKSTLDPAYIYTTLEYKYKLTALEDPKLLEVALRFITRNLNEEGEKIQFPVLDEVDRINLKRNNLPTNIQELLNLVDEVFERREEPLDLKKIYRQFVRAHGRTIFNPLEKWPQCYQVVKHA